MSPEARSFSRVPPGGCHADPSPAPQRSKAVAMRRSEVDRNLTSGRGRRGEPRLELELFAGSEPRLLGDDDPTVEPVPLRVPDGEPDRGKRRGLRPQICDFAFNPQNVLKAVVQRDRMKIRQRQAAQIDRESQSRIDSRGAGPQSNRLRAPADECHGSCKASEADEQIDG